MSQFISLQEGITMTQEYRQQRSELIQSGAIASDLLPLNETFDTEQVKTLLAKEGCKSLRVYLGLTEQKVSLILVAVNGRDEDILPLTNQANANDGDDDDLLQHAIRCPTICPPASSLNS